MSTGKAIVSLRKRLGLTQRAFAKLLGVSHVSVARWERGREPASKLMWKLADISKEAGLDHLFEFFWTKRRTNITERVANLSSSGTERRMHIGEVNFIDLATEFISNEGREKTALNLTEKLHSTETAPAEREKIKERLESYIRDNAKVAREIHEQMQPYIDHTRPSVRDVYAVHSLMSEDDGTDLDLDKMSTPDLIRLAKETAEETEQIARDTRRLANEGTTENSDSITERRKAG